MVDEAKPGADVCRVSWCGQIADGVQVLLAGTYTVGRYFETSELDCVSSKDKLVWVEDNTMVATEVEPGDCLKEALR